MRWVQEEKSDSDEEPRSWSMNEPVVEMEPVLSLYESLSGPASSNGLCARPPCCPCVVLVLCSTPAHRAPATAARPGSKPRTRRGGTLVDAPLIPESSGAAAELPAPTPPPPQPSTRTSSAGDGAAIASLLGSGPPPFAAKPPLSPGVRAAGSQPSAGLPVPSQSPEAPSRRRHSFEPEKSPAEQPASQTPSDRQRSFGARLQTAVRSPRRRLRL